MARELGKGILPVSKNNDVVIVAAARTAIGTFGGILKDVRAHTLAAHVMREVLSRAKNLDGNLVSDIIVGDCLQAVDEANTARTAALKAGIPVKVPALPSSEIAPLPCKRLLVGPSKFSAETVMWFLWPVLNQ